MLLRLRAWFVLFCFLMALGCATTRFAQWSDHLGQTDPQKQLEGKRIETEGDALYQAKSENDNLFGALVKWEVALQFSPSRELYLKLAQGHLYLAEIDPSKTSEAALAFSEKALSLYEPQFVLDLKSGQAMSNAVKEVKKPAALALFVYAKALQKWSEKKGLLTKWRYRNDVKDALGRAVELGVNENSDGQVPDSGQEITR